MKNKKLPPGVVDEERGDHGSDIGIGGVKAEESDEQVARRGSENKGDRRNGVEEHQFVVPFMFTGLEDEQDVEDVGGEVGEHEADDFADPVVPQADRFRDSLYAQPESGEQSGNRIAFCQCRKNQPGKEKKNGHIHHCGRAAAESVFDELDKAVVFLVQKSLNMFLHRRAVCP